MSETIDLDYDELDPGIRSTVRWLRSHGFRTVDYRMFPCPQVRIALTLESAERLEGLLARAGFKLRKPFRKCAPPAPDEPWEPVLILPVGASL